MLGINRAKPNNIRIRDRNSTKAPRNRVINELDSVDKDTNNPINTPINIIGISIRIFKRSIQLYSDRDALPRRLAQFLKKLLIASLNEIISLGLSEPEIKLPLMDSKEKLVLFILPIPLIIDFELKWGSIKLQENNTVRELEKINKIRKGIKLPRESNALKRKETANKESDPTVGKSPMNDLPNGPNS